MVDEKTSQTVNEALRASTVKNTDIPKIEKAIQPVLEHLTNNEPWYQSRVTWGAIIAGVAGVAGLLGYSFDAEDQAFWVDNISQGITLATSIASLLGGAIAWYGRWKAKKPLGS